ncbi:MAG: hypothetical protein V1790_16285 [Planctomycetota bacterium]
MPLTGSTAEALTGSIERVTFHNPDGGFAVLRLKAKGHTELVSVVGHLPSAAEGESELDTERVSCSRSPQR